MRDGRLSRFFGCSNALVLSGLVASGCVTQPKRQEPSEIPGQEKAGTKQEVAKPVAKLPAESAGPSVDDQLLFVHRQSVPEAPFGVGEYQFLASLPQTAAPGSVTEAALAIGLVRTVLHPLTGAVPSFQEADLGQGSVGKKAPEAAARKAPTLELLCRERGLDLPRALTDNQLLNNAGIARQAAAALNQGENSKEFTKGVHDALKQQARMWSEVAGAIPAPGAGADAPPNLAPLPPMPADAAAAPGPQSASGATSASPGAAGPGPDIPTLQPAGAAATGAVAGAAAGTEAAPVGPPPAPSDNPLSDAQALADRGDYAGAIRKAQAVPENSPQAGQAKDKIKEYSNLGVQDLRKKAASAFQTAMQSSDPKTRGGYLKQAKVYLEEALKSYPDATQLPTVRENLRVISQDLDKL